MGTNKNIITKETLIHIIAKKYDLTDSQSKIIVNDIFESIKNALAKGEEISIPHFGKLTISESAAREGVNPSTGEKIHIEASNKVKFKPSSELKELIDPDRWSKSIKSKKIKEEKNKAEIKQIDEALIEEEISNEEEKLNGFVSQPDSNEIKEDVQEIQENEVEEEIKVFEQEPKKEVKESKKIKSDNDHEKFYFDSGKMFYMWPSMLHIKRKAKKIIKKNLKQPGTYSEEYRYNWLKKAATKMIRLANIDIKVEGIENWSDRGIILAPNHQSNIDPVILLAINDFSIQQPLAFIAKKELWESKTMSSFVNLIDCVPLDRNNPRSALEAFKEGKDLVVNFKRSLVIFPEGTRSGSQEIGEFQPASMKIAQMANAPVVPVTIINSYMEDKNKRKSKRLEVKVIFGKPISPIKHISLKTEDLTKNVRKEVVSNMEKWIDKEPSLVLAKAKKVKETKKPKEKKSAKDIFKIVD